MTQYALVPAEVWEKLELVKVEAGSPEDAGRTHTRQMYGDSPPGEQKYTVIVDSAITDVTVRAKTNVTLDVQSNREVRRRASETRETVPGNDTPETPEAPVEV